MPDRFRMLAAFVLGACAGTTGGLEASSDAQITPSETSSSVDTNHAPVVLHTSTTESLVAPNGKARLTRFASGTNAFVGRLELEGHVEIPPHRDSTEEYIVILSGGGTLMIDGTPHQVSEGSSVYMPANAEVSYANGPETLVALQVFAGPAPAAKYDNWSHSD